MLTALNQDGSRFSYIVRKNVDLIKSGSWNLKEDPIFVDFMIDIFAPIVRNLLGKHKNQYFVEVVATCLEALDTLDVKCVQRFIHTQPP